MDVRLADATSIPFCGPNLRFLSLACSTRSDRRQAARRIGRASNQRGENPVENRFACCADLQFEIGLNCFQTQLLG
jgi:hypothetical protein